MKSPDIRPGRGREPINKHKEIAGSYRKPMVDTGDPNWNMEDEIPSYHGPVVSRETPIVKDLQVTDEQGTSTMLKIEPASRVNPKTSSTKVGSN